MRRIRTATLATIWSLTLVVTIAGAVASTPDQITLSDLVEAVVIVVLTVGMSGLGVLIVVQANNRIGWLLCLGGLLLAFQYWTFVSEPGPTAQWLSTSVGYVAGLLLIPTVILLFPDGRLPSRRWRPVAWLGIGGATAGTLSVLFAPTIFETNDPAPLAGVLPDTVRAFFDAATFGLLPFLVAVIASLIIRYRSAESLQRLQLKMFGYGAAVALAGSLVTNLIAFDEIDPLVPGAISAMALPLSIAAAIMRYRLFDLDRLISRTIGYAIVIATLALVYVAGAVWLPAQIIGEQSSAFVAGSTLVVASLLNPVRRRVISRVDQRFNRSRYDAQKVIAEFSERLKDEIDIDQITADSTAVISRTVQPESMRVWIRGPETGGQ
jgi:uncharacterized membrane protein